MASSVTSDKIATHSAIVGKLLTGASTVITAYVALRDVRNFGCLATVAALTGSGMTKLELLAYTDGSGGGGVVIKDSGTIAADAVNDQAFLEFTVDELAHLGTAFTHAAARVTLQNNADKVIAVTITEGSRFQYDGMTAATTIA